MFKCFWQVFHHEFFSSILSMFLKLFILLNEFLSFLQRVVWTFPLFHPFHYIKFQFLIIKFHFLFLIAQFISFDSYLKGHLHHCIVHMVYLAQLSSFEFVPKLNFLNLLVVLILFVLDMRCLLLILRFVLWVLSYLLLAFCIFPLVYHNSVWMSLWNLGLIRQHLCFLIYS